MSTPDSPTRRVGEDDPRWAHGPPDGSVADAGRKGSRLAHASASAPGGDGHVTTSTIRQPAAGSKVRGSATVAPASRSGSGRSTVTARTASAGGGRREGRRGSRNANKRRMTEAQAHELDDEEERALLRAAESKCDRSRRVTGEVMMSIPMEMFVIFVVLVFAMLFVIEMVIDEETRLKWEDELWLADLIILSLMVMEILARLYAFGLEFLKNGWNLFDAVVVVISIVMSILAKVLNSVLVLRVFRLRAILRLFRLVVVWNRVQKSAVVVRKLKDKRGMAASPLEKVLHALHELADLPALGQRHRDNIEYMVDVISSHRLYERGTLDELTGGESGEPVDAETRNWLAAHYMNPEANRHQSRVGNVRDIRELEMERQGSVKRRSTTGAGGGGGSDGRPRVDSFASGTTGGPASVGGGTAFSGPGGIESPHASERGVEDTLLAADSPGKDAKEGAAPGGGGGGGGAGGGGAIRTSPLTRHSVPAGARGGGATLRTARSDASDVSLRSGVTAVSAVSVTQAEHERMRRRLSDMLATDLATELDRIDMDARSARRSARRSSGRPDAEDVAALSASGGVDRAMPLDAGPPGSAGAGGGVGGLGMGVGMGMGSAGGGSSIGGSAGSLTSSRGKLTLLKTSSRLKLFSERALKMERCLGQLDKWDFDVFGAAELSGGFPLFLVSYNLLQLHNCLAPFDLHGATVRKCLHRIEAGYLHNSYHNSTHAADVVQTISFLFSQPFLLPYITALEKLSAILAAAIHDYAHPGLNNAFQVATSAPLALRYNDKAVLECYHVASFFEMIHSDPELDMFAGMDAENRSTARSLIIGMVLSTDMAVHFEEIAKFKSKLIQVTREMAKYEVSAGGTATPGKAGGGKAAGGKGAPGKAPAGGGGGGDDDDDEDDEGGYKRTAADTELFLRLALHTADVSNPAKPLFLAKQWTERVCEEFYAQGDQERELGLPISAFMDRNAPNVPKLQLGFINFIVGPLYEEWASVMEEVRDSVMPHLESVKVYWQRVAEHGAEEAARKHVEDEGRRSSASAKGGGGGGGAGAGAATGAAKGGGASVKGGAAVKGGGGGAGAGGGGAHTAVTVKK